MIAFIFLKHINLMHDKEFVNYVRSGAARTAGARREILLQCVFIDRYRVSCCVSLRTADSKDFRLFDSPTTQPVNVYLLIHRLFTLYQCG